MLSILSFFTSPLGKWAGIIVAVSLVFGSIYAKGRIDGREAYKARIERQIKDAIEKGTNARERSLRDLDAGRVPDGWFRD